MKPRRGDPVSWINADHSDRGAWLELAVDSGLEVLQVQRDDLSGMRSRAVTFSALTVTAVAFLAGTGLSGTGGADEPIRNAFFYVLSIVGTVGFVVIAVFLVATVAPWREFKFVLEPDALMRWAEGEAAAPSKQVAMNYLASEQLPTMIDHNWKQLKTLRSRYRILLIAGVSTMIAWIPVVWLYA